MLLEGGCLCRAVRYTFDGRPAMVFCCYCRDCQRHGGSLVHYGVLVPESSLSMRGELKGFESDADTGRKITRKFCPTCGSGICNILEIAPGMVVLKGGTIDDAETRPHPTFELFTESKTPWLSIDGLRGFERDAKAPVKELMWKET